MSLGVFISASRDMASEAARAGLDLRGFALERGLEKLNLVDYRDIDPASLDHGRPWQDHIEQPSAPGIDLVLVLLGERIGKPTPSNFRWAADIAQRLSLAGIDWVHVAGIDEGEPNEDQVPLTGTLYEFFDSTLPHLDGRPLPRVVVAFWGHQDSRGEPVFGEGRWHNTYVNESGISTKERIRRDREYIQQAKWLDCLYAKRFASEHNIHIFLNTPEALTAAVRRAMTEASGLDQSTLDPFGIELPGLAPYNEALATLFLGRKEELHELAKLTFEERTDQKLVLVHGMTGSGKSSLLQSGLLAEARNRQRRQLELKTAFVSLADIASTERPLVAIARLLAQSWPGLGSADQLSQRMECAGREAVDRLLDHINKAFEAIRSPGASMLIICDQAEVALDRRPAATDPHGHWAALLELMRRCRPTNIDADGAGESGTAQRLVESGRLTLVAAVPSHRLEEFDTCVTPHPGYQLRVSDYLSEATLKSIAGGTLRQLGLPIERGLVEAIVEGTRHIAQTAPALPLLAGCLRRLHESWKTRVGQSALPDLWRLEVARPGASRRLRDAIQYGTGIGDDVLREAQIYGGARLLEAVKLFASPQTMPAMSLYALMQTADPVLKIQHFNEIGGVGGLVELLGEEAIMLAASQVSNARHNSQASPQLSSGAEPDATNLIDRSFQSLMRKCVLIAPSYWKIPDHLQTLAVQAVSEDEWPLLQALIAKRLATRTEDGGYRLIHEAILTLWKRAADWRRDEKEFFEIYESVLGECTEWERFQDTDPAKSASYLLPNVARLGSAIDLLGRWGLDFNKTITEFVKCSSLVLASSDADAAGRATVAATFFRDRSWLASALANSPDRRRTARYISPRGGTALANAVMIEDLEMIDQLLLAGADPATAGAGRNSALHHAAASGSGSMLQRLLKKVPWRKRRAALNAENSEGQTPFMITFGQDLDLARALARKGGNRRLISSTGYTAAHEAAAALDVLGFRYATARFVFGRKGSRFVPVGVDIRVLNSVDDSGSTPMGTFTRALHAFSLDTADELISETARRRLTEEAEESEESDADAETNDPVEDIKTEETTADPVSDRHRKLMTFHQVVLPAIAQEFERRVEYAAATDSSIGALYSTFKGKNLQQLVSEPGALASKGKIFKLIALQQQAVQFHVQTEGVFQDALQDALQRLELPHEPAIVAKVRFLLRSVTPMAEASTRLGAIALSGWIDSLDFDFWPPQFRWSTDEAALTSAGRALRNRGLLLDVLRTARFSFMPHCELLEVGRWENRALLLSTPFIVRALDKTNAPIYWLSEVGLLDLTDENVEEYVVFFFHLVRGHLGRFLIVSKAEDMRWTDRDNPPEDQFNQCKEYIRPLYLTDRPGQDGWKLRASVQFKDALFETDVIVSRDGLIELANEELRAEDLAVRY